MSQLIANNNYPLSAKELRGLYKCSPDTWRKWIKPLIDAGTIEPYTKVYTPKQLNAIIAHLDPPN